MAKRQTKKLADVSAKTLKTREKLKRKLESIDKSVTPQALKQKIAEIHRWISRNAVDRIPLRSKTIALFDCNQNVAETSLKVRKIAESIQASNVIRKEGLVNG